MAAPKLKTALSAVAGATLALTPLTAANSQQAEFQEVAAAQITSDADRAAGAWVRENPSGISVSVRLGAETPVQPNVIEATLRNDFEKNGISNVKFFFERGGNGTSSVAYHTHNFVYGPYGLAVSRQEVAKVAQQNRFELASNL